MTGPDAWTPMMQSAQRQLCAPGLDHDEAVITLAATLGAADPHALREALDEAARPLFGLAGAELGEQAPALVACLHDGLRLRAAGAPEGRMLLHEALRDHDTHPTLMALVGHALARRGGLHSVVAWSLDGYWTLLIDRGAFLPIGCAPDSPTTGYELQACCAHQVAHELLCDLAGDGPPQMAQDAELLAEALVTACTAAWNASHRG